ncbi:MAG: sugar kinase [Pseudomonadota bacterium]
MSTRRFDLVGLGECMVELYADQPLGSVAQLTRAYGGDVLNALVTAARMGGNTGFITRVGADPFGQCLLDAWRNEGVDTSHAPLAAGDNGVYFISLRTGGEREFTYRRRDSAASRLDEGDIDAAYIASARYILLSGITQAISVSARAATLAAAKTARAHGVSVAYDPNYRPALWAECGGIDAARAAFAELLPLTDCLLPSYPADLALLPAGAGLSAAASSPSFSAGASHFAGLAPHVAVKCGADGCVLLAGGEAIHVPADVPPAVLDTTGAGDAWNGAYLLRRARGVAFEAAAIEANRVAAAKLAHRGAIPPSFNPNGAP